VKEILKIPYNARNTMSVCKRVIMPEQAMKNSSISNL
jgi:hypothetical protein